MALSRDSQAYIGIRGNLKRILEGVVCCFDPSIGSNSSMPGWAVYSGGRLTHSGTIDIDPSGSIPVRLARLAYRVRQIYIEYNPDICIYEEIPAQRTGGGANANSHASLLKAVGTILSVPGPDAHIGIYPISWKKMVRPEYVKGDEADAVEIGWICIQEAARIQEQDPPGRYVRKKRGTSRKEAV